MKSTKQKILIAGIGGVGGYFGGLLSKAYEHHKSIEVCFFARGTHLKEIQSKGLEVIKGNDAFITNPTLATDDPNKIGIVNLLIICTKSYDLELVVKQIQPCINKQTIILPLLNGVDSSDRIKDILPENRILMGCVYIISKIKMPGVIENFGNIQKLYFGANQPMDESCQQIEAIFKDAEIEAKHSDDILKVIWEKFIFISATATATSFFDNTIGEILADKDKREQLMALINEATQIAILKGIPVSKGIRQETLRKLASMPFETTSSMQRDIRAGKRAEISLLTEVVVKEGIPLKHPTPTYDNMLRGLTEKS